MKKFKKVFECYYLDNGEWQLYSESLKTARSGHGASNVGEKIWVTGGVTGVGQTTLSSTEIIHDGKVTSGPNLPKGRYGHCQVTYEQTTFILGKQILCQYS